MFYIHPTEQPLVEAAIRLGEWFLASADLDAGGREVVENVMEALRRLPAVTTGVSGSYGFRVIDDALNEWDYPSAEIPIGKEQLWNVSFCRVGASPNDPSSGEIWFEALVSGSTGEPRSQLIVNEAHRRKIGCEGFEARPPVWGDLGS